MPKLRTLVDEALDSLVILERQGMVRMYSTLTKAPKHAVVISELLAAHGHQFATVKPTYQQNPSTNTVTLVFNIHEGPKAQRSRNRS
jgi:outer membrane protein assembly factor BamA